jgi:hypothetical protein
VERNKVKVSGDPCWAYVDVCASESLGLVVLNGTIQLAAKVTQLSAQWRSAQIVRTKEKVCEWYHRRVPSRSR